MIWIAWEAIHLPLLTGEELKGANTLPSRHPTPISATDSARLSF